MTIFQHSARSIRRLNSRQRKKQRVGEFQEFVFAIRVSFKEALVDSALDRFVDEFISLLASRGLMVAGLGGKLPLAATEGIISLAERGSPTAEDRQAVLDWLSQRADVARAEAGDMVDAWYGW